MTSKINRALLLYYVKLCASFQIHRWIEIVNILSRVTLKFDGWPFKTIGHLFYTTLSFVHNFKSIGTVKLELQSRNTQFGSKLVISLSPVTWKFDGWPWKIIGHLFYTTLSFVHHFKTMVEFNLELQSENTQFGSNLAIFCPTWPGNLTDDHENNRAPLLCCFKFCASFHSHWWIQTGVTVRKCSIRVKIGNFLSNLTLKFDGWPWKTIGRLF